jgi:hypothetical protein
MRDVNEPYVPNEGDVRKNYQMGFCQAQIMDLAIG